MTVLIIIGVLWLATVVFVVCLCRAAATGDEDPLERRADLSFPSAEGQMGLPPDIYSRVVVRGERR